jgi:dienelactone hydrolase
MAGSWLTLAGRARRRTGVLVLAALTGALTAGCTASAAPAAHLRMRVSERVSLFDAPLDIQVTGLSRGDQVTVRLALSNGGSAAQATFDAPGPVLNLDQTAPVSGGYRGTDGMGLFEAQVPRNEALAALTGDSASFTLTASTPAGGTATVRLTRDLTGPGVTCRQLRVADAGFYGEYCAPAPHAGLRPPVLTFGGSEGGETPYEAELLASRGYPALALAYFDEPGLPDALDRIPLEYFGRAASWLGRQPGADPRALTVWGVSRGSEAALQLGAYFPGLVHAVIAGSPSSVTNGAFPGTRSVTPGDPAWTLRGQPVPVAFPYGAAVPDNPAALIPVQRIRAPVLLLVGADDTLWPSGQYAQEIMFTLRQAHFRYPYQDLVFAGAGHYVGGAFPYNVTPVTGETTAAGRTAYPGGSTFGDAVATARAWQDVLAFLHRLT